MNAFSKIKLAPTAITSTTDIMSGDPCVAGTRVPVETVLVHFEAGYSEEDFLGDYSWLPTGVYAAALAWAKANDRAVKLPVRRVPDPQPGRRG